MSRTAEISRQTHETTVELALDLDGGEVSADTGVGFLDHMLELLGRHGRLGLRVEATGDLETGAHHTVEDVGIVLGQAVDRALGGFDVVERAPAEGEKNWVSGYPRWVVAWRPEVNGKVTVDVVTGSPRSMVCICLVAPRGWSTVLPSSKTHWAARTRRLPTYQLRLRPPTTAFLA